MLLKNFALINISKLDERIEELKRKAQSAIPAYETTICYKQIDELTKVKLSLIPSEKLAEVAFDAAREFNSLDGIVDINIVLNMPQHDLSDLQERITKQEFLNSEINLD